MENRWKIIRQFPIGAIASTVGLCTLSNVYNMLGFSFFRHLVMLFGTLVWGIVVLKISFCFKTFKEEYRQVVPASLYATFPMLTAILSSYYYNYIASLGSILWYAAVFVHFSHICLFTYRNVFKTFDRKTFLPTWLVTYVGILVTVVVGNAIGPAWLTKGLLIYGFIITGILIPSLVFVGVPDKMAITKTIFLAPFSLCLISYLNVATEPSFPFVACWYGITLFVLLLVSRRLLDFLKRDFDATFASLTFPLAIVTSATYRTEQYFIMINNGNVAFVINQIFGVLLFFVTGILLFVSYQFAYQFSQSLTEK